MMTFSTYIIGLIMLFIGYQITRPFDTPRYPGLKVLIFAFRFMLPIYGIIWTYIFFYYATL